MAPDLDSFCSQVVTAVTKRRTRKTIAPMFHPSLAETDWLAAYSPRHKRWLYKSVLGISQKELRAIQNVHQFLGQTCDFATGMPRIVEYVNADSFYDQPHLNNAFKYELSTIPISTRKKSLAVCCCPLSAVRCLTSPPALRHLLLD